MHLCLCFVVGGLQLLILEPSEDQIKSKGLSVTLGVVRAREAASRPNAANAQRRLFLPKIFISPARMGVPLSVVYTAAVNCFDCQGELVAPWSCLSGSYVRQRESTSYVGLPQQDIRDTTNLTRQKDRSPPVDIEKT